MTASPTVASQSPQSRRDRLAALLLDVLTSPNPGTNALAERCASVALTFCHLAGSDERLAARHRDQREKVLLRALAQALRVVEQNDIGEALKIADELSETVAPLAGEPLVLTVEEPGFTLTCPVAINFLRPGGAA